MRRGKWAAAATAAVAVLLAIAPEGAPAARSTVLGKVRIWKIAYRAHNGERRNAFVMLPRSYRPGHSPPIPLVISPHGRGVTGRGNLKLWGQLPAVGGFAVVSPDGQGRRLSNYSWGSAGQISDLARMPQIVHLTLPWVHVDYRHVYAFGGSMGGQETLLLVARHPRLLAGAAAFDPVVDFRLQYHDFPELGCSRSCKQTWHGSVGRALQALARAEIGGSPTSVPYAYELRSPLTYARSLAFAHVPLQIWWTPKDAIVIHQQRQAAKLVDTITRLNPAADLLAFTGGWRHSAEMRAKARLPLALTVFGLLPDRYGRLQGIRIVAAGPTPHFNERRPRS